MAPHGCARTHRMACRPLRCQAWSCGLWGTRGRTRRFRPRACRERACARGWSSRGVEGQRALPLVPVRVSDRAGAAFRAFGPTSRRRRAHFTAKNLRGPATAPQRLRLPLPGRHRGTFRLCAHFLRRRPGLGTAQARPKLRAVRDARPKSDETAVYWPSMATDVAPGDSVTLRGQESACFRVFLAKKKYIEKYA